ncbi:MAG: hypothetical protein PHU63_01295 [Candidatus ainarchaeum sp.]|nr:hypothetical protein [Candidatus ainarchaeum sp.]
MYSTKRQIPPRKIAVLHFTRRPYPVDPAFFGQNFIPLSLSACSRSEQFREYGMKNHAFVREVPKCEGIRKDMEEISRVRFNTELHFGYGDPRVVLSMVKGMVDEGYLPVLDFHYPVQDSRLMVQLDKALREMGIRERVVIVNHLHITPQYIRAIPGDNDIRGGVRKTNAGRILQLEPALQVSDLTIGVSEDAINAFRRIRYNQWDNRPDGALLRSGDLGEAIGERYCAILNGINPNLYTPRTEDEKEEGRASIGLNPKLGITASYVARLDGLKGGRTLIEILRRYNGWYGGNRDEWGFVLACADIIQPTTRLGYIKDLLKLKRLIESDRLKVVIDISKFTRGDPRFRDAVIRILEYYANDGGFEEIRKMRIFGGYVDTPIQGVTDVLLHTAVHEALGLALVEANFSGAGVIARKVGGIPEVIPTNKEHDLKVYERGGSGRYHTRTVSYSEHGILIHQEGAEDSELDATIFMQIMDLLKPDPNGKGSVAPIEVRDRFSEATMTARYLDAVIRANEVRV